MSGSQHPDGERDFTVDAFHRGRYHLVQPTRGHRAGMDAMMLAAAVPGSFRSSLADLGSGAGAAGLAVATRCPGARVDLIERDPVMADFARRSLALAENAELASRSTVIEADVSLAGRARLDAGLADNAYDFAIMNPPFNETRDRMSPDLLRAGAHVMTNGMFGSWLRTAAAIVRPRGGLAVIARPVSLAEVLAAIEGRFGSAQIIAIHPRIGEPAIRFVLRAVRGSRARLSLQPPLILHGTEGNRYTSEADNLNNGRTSLFGD